MSFHSVKQFAAIGLLALTGCSYNLALVSNMNGDTVAKGFASKYGKVVSITLDGRVYSGHYADAPQGSISLASFAASMPTAAGVVVGVDAVGAVTVAAATADRDELRCVYNYNGNVRKGSGQCVTQGGRVFSLVVTPG